MSEILPDSSVRTCVAAANPTNRAWAEIDMGALRWNIQALREHLGSQCRIMAVVKANAYGHGLLPIAIHAQSFGVDWIGIAAVSEGIALREAGVTLPIALLCGFAPDEAGDVLHYNIIPTIGDTHSLEALARAASSIRDASLFTATSPEIHIEIDTGIGRAGIDERGAVGLWAQAIKAGLRVTGLMSHFSDADGDEKRTREQAAAFGRARLDLISAGASFETVHLSNSPGIMRLAGSGSNMVRPGLLTYGIRPQVKQRTGNGLNNEPSDGEGKGPATGANDYASRRKQLLPTVDWRPVLSLKTRVATVRSLPAGAPISYGSTHHLVRPSRIATVLIGYGDGYSRRISNRGSMLVRGRRAPILGRVCMDQTVIDVTDIPDASPGDIAVCIGTMSSGMNGSQTITVGELALHADAIDHEITTGLTDRLPRVLLPAKDDEAV